MDTAIAVPKAEAVEKEATTALEKARAYAIVTDADFQGAAQFLRDLKTIQKAIDETFDGPIKAAHLAHKAIVAAKNSHMEPLTEAERIVKGKAAAYQLESQRKAEEERARLEAKARRQAEDEALAAAAAAEASGDKDTAEAILAEPVTTAPVKAPAPVKAAGLSFKEKYDGEVFDLHAVIRFIAVNPQFAYLLAPDKTAIRKLAEASKGATAIPGLRWVKASVAAVRA